MSIVLIVLFSSNAFALNNGSENYSEVNVAEAANQIIGQSDVVPETRVPNN